MDVFEAIADPVRRAILEALRDGPLTAGAVAARFPISRPAVSRHLRVLRERGLVVDSVTGRERRYTLEPGPLEAVGAWVDGLRPVWEHRLDALATEVHRTRRERRSEGTRAAGTTRPTAQEHTA